MFNWYAAPTFAAMLCFWLLACYVLTRSPRSALTLAAVGAQIATAAYLLGQGMQANAASLAEWRPWARNLQWGALLAPTLWYWVTALLLADLQASALRRYLRRVGYPLGMLLATATVALTIALYGGDGLYRWSTAAPVAAAPVTYYRFVAPPGPWYPAVIGFLLVSTLGAAANLWLGRRLPLAADRRARLTWLLGSAALFVGSVACLSLAIDRGWPFWAIWAGHLALIAAMAVMASNVAAYSLLLKVEVIRRDLLYFLTALTAVALGYGVVFALLGPGYSFQVLALLMGTLVVTILAYALFDIGRRLLDRLFFPAPVQELRSLASEVAQGAAVAPDLGPVLDEASAGLAEVSADHLVRLTEAALRRLNNPAALARCGLAEQLPRTLAARGAEAGTPLERAHALRELLIAAIERLKPPDRLPAGAPGALQYHILREEYVLALPNKQIVARHAISESTFHRQRREAIAILAQELGKQEGRAG